MFQDPYASLDPRMRVGSILKEPLVVQHIGSSDERDHRVREPHGRWVWPQGRSTSTPTSSPAVNARRIGLARALTLDPKLIVADEPVSALDVSIQAQILNLLKELQSGAT